MTTNINPHWHKLETLENGVIFTYYIEVHEDMVIRQVEQYGDCWIYSGDAESYCLYDGFEVYGCLTDQSYSSLLKDMPFIEIGASDFAEAWAIAQEKARLKSYTALQNCFKTL